MKLKKLLLMMLAAMLIFGFGAFGTAKDTAVASAEEIQYKPIRGVRKTSENTVGRLKKAEVKARIEEEKSEIEAVKEKIQMLRQQFLAYQQVKEATDVSGTVFADNGYGTGLFGEVAQFDNYFKKIENYGNVNENFLSSNYLDPDVDDTNGLYLASLVSDRVSAVTLLQSENTEAVDISAYLSYKMYRKQERIQRLRTRLDKKRNRIRKLREESETIVTNDIVFNSENVTEVSNISVEKMREILRGTKLEQFAGVYVEIEQRYGINAIAICALSAYESGWGESRRAREDHNYTGFGVYSNSSRGINAASGEANLLMTAEHLAKCYLEKGDIYYHGVGLDGLNRSYSTAGSWAYDIEYIGTQLMDALQA